MAVFINIQYIGTDVLTTFALNISFQANEIQRKAEAAAKCLAMRNDHETSRWELAYFREKRKLNKIQMRKMINH